MSEFNFDKITEIYEEYLKVGSVREVGRKFGLGQKQVAGLIGSYMKSFKPNLDNVYDDFLNGASVVELSRKYQRSKTSIRSELRKRKFKMSDEDVYVLLIDDYISGMKESDIVEKYILENTDSLRIIISKNQPQVNVALTIKEYEKQIDGKKHIFHSRVGLFKIYTDFIIVTERYNKEGKTYYSVLPKLYKKDEFENIFNNRDIISYSIEIYKNITYITIRG